MIKVIKAILQQWIDDIDSGNSNISEEQQEEILEFCQKLTSKELTKTESANYIGVSRATFDNYISKGLIPKGSKRPGLSSLLWSKSDLDKYLETK